MGQGCMKRALIKSVNLLGDGLYVGPVAEKWYTEKGKEYDEIHLLTILNYAMPIYEGMGVPWKVVTSPEGSYDLEIDFDVSKAFQISDQKKCHLVNAYAELAGISPAGIKAIPNYKPPVIDVLPKWHDLILLSMHSMSCSSQANVPGPPNKMLPSEKWKPLLQVIKDEYPEAAVRLVGGKNDAVPTNLGFTEEQYELLGKSIPETANIMACSKFIITVDNGMGHLAASQGLDEFLLMPWVLSPHYIAPHSHRGLRWVHVDPPNVDAKKIAWHLRSAIRDWKDK